MLIFLGTQAILSFVLKKVRLLDVTSFDIASVFWDGCFTFNETGNKLKTINTCNIKNLCVCKFICVVSIQKEAEYSRLSKPVAACKSEKN